MLGVDRTDLRSPDWFRDPVTGRRSDPAQYAFRLNHRSEEVVGNVKQVWELSRHHHLTLLAAAWYLTHDDAYAERVADHLNAGGGRTRSCPACTGPAGSRSASG